MNPQIFAAGINGRNRVVTTQRRVNYYYGWDLNTPDQQTGSPAQGPDRAEWAIYDRSPLNQVAYLGANRVRGMLRFGNTLFVVQNSALYAVAPNFSFVQVGTLASSQGRVTMDAIQGFTGFEIGIVDSANVMYLYNITTGVFSVVTAPALLSLTAGHSFFIGSVVNSGQWNISNIGDGTTWPGLSFSNADSDPDNLICAKHYADVLHLFGERSTEFWGFSGQGTPPWQRISVNAVDWGLASLHSVAPFGRALMALMRNRMGEVVACKIQQGQIIPVSPPDLNFIFNGFIDNFQAEGCSWILNGHLQYRLFFPLSLQSWMYDEATNLWSEETSFGGLSTAPALFGPHRGAISAEFNGQVVFGDYADGALYVANPRQANYADQLLGSVPDQPIERELVGRHLFDMNKMQVLAALELDCNSGDGEAAANGAQPQMMLAMSRDKGRTWSKERWRSLGASGQFRTRVRFQNLGRARDLTVKIRVTDAARCIITGEVLLPGTSQGRM